MLYQIKNILYILFFIKKNYVINIKHLEDQIFNIHHKLNVKQQVQKIKQILLNEIQKVKEKSN